MRVTSNKRLKGLSFYEWTRGIFLKEKKKVSVYKLQYLPFKIKKNTLRALLKPNELEIKMKTFYILSIEINEEVKKNRGKNRNIFAKLLKSFWRTHK